MMSSKKVKKKKKKLKRVFLGTEESIIYVI